MSGYKPKKRLPWWAKLLIVLLVLLLIPIPFTYKDGGSVELCAVLYRFWKWNAIWEEPDGQGGYRRAVIKGVTLEIPGFLEEGWTILDTSRVVFPGD